MTLQVEHFEKLITSPRLPDYAQRIQSILAAEKQKRNDFYNQIDEGDKAEFINGEAIFHSPVKLRHNNVSGHLYRLFSTYVLLHDLGFVGHEKIMISLTRNDYEPDICYFDKAKSLTFQPQQMRFPAPDFVVEILSESTAKNDRGVKFEDYAAHGVGEYWIIDPETETVEQYQLQNDAYALLVKAKTGSLDSFVVPGFTIPVRAIFDEEINRQTLQTLLSSA